MFAAFAAIAATAYHIWGVGPRGHEKGADFLLLCIEDDRVSPQFRNHRVGSLVGVPNLVHTFRDNVIFVGVRGVRGNRSDGVLVDRKPEFILALGDLVFRMECFLVVGESGQGDPWVLERRFNGAAAIQGFIVCYSAHLVFADDEG